MTVSVGVCVHSIDRSGAPGRPAKLTTPNPMALSERAWRVKALSKARSPKAKPSLPLVPSGNDTSYSRPASLNIGGFLKLIFGSWKDLLSRAVLLLDTRGLLPPLPDRGRGW